MSTMLNIYDRNMVNGRLVKTAVLQNAFNIVETHELNQIYTLSFTLPSTDEKNKFCLPRHFVRWGDDGELYRIKSPKVQESDTGTITYECEHAITTLCDSIMFGSYIFGGRGMHTVDVLVTILGMQKTHDWDLDRCDFDRQFEYNWEQENILNALYSIPKEFATPYQWVFDTQVYPWRISLIAIDTTVKPEFYLRGRSNILSSSTAADYANICTRIYPLGYGEGVNQLNIKEATVESNSIVRNERNQAINGTVVQQGGVKYNNTYIQSPKAYTDKYGIVEKVLVDRRFENANSLFAYAQTMLDLYQEPSMSRTFDVTDLYPLTNYDWNNAEVGKKCKMTEDETTAYITKCRWQRDKAGDLQIDLSTKTTDIAQNVADLADRIRIESVYAQGATQLYQHSKDANATPQKGMVISLYFPEEMRQINKVLMRLKLEKFRSYSQTATYRAGGITSADNINTQDGGEVKITDQISTENGGGITKNSNKTTELGGAITKDDNKTTENGGGITKEDNKTTNLGGAITMADNKFSQVGGGISASEDKRTGLDGKIDTKSSSSGGQSGQTGVASGGGSITLSPSVNVSIQDTGDAQWKATNTTSIRSLDTNINSEYASTSVGLQSNGSHDHDYSGSVDDEGEYSGTTEKNGSHSHTVVDNTGHSHAINKSELKHNHSVDANVSVTVNNSAVGFSGFSHSHSFYVPDHTHQITIPSHSHQITLSDHKHQIVLSAHKHQIILPKHNHQIVLSAHKHQIVLQPHKHKIIIDPHQHDIIPGIFESGDATAFDIYVGNVKKTTVNAKNFDGDITVWLLNNQNMVPRGSWIDVTIVPNDLAYVVCSVFVQGFVQSRGGGNY